MEKGDLDDIETTPFIHGPLRSDLHVETRSRRSQMLCRFAIHLALILIYTTISLAVMFSKGSCSAVFSDALSDLTIQFKPKMSVPAPMSPFVGPPSREVDLAWHTLLGNTSIRVSQEELNRNGNHNKSVALPRSEEHLAWLNVFHQLHCLKKIRQFIYRDYYGPNMTEIEARDMEVHVNHCLEVLRQTLMCNPDTSLTTFFWSHSDKKPILNEGRFERQCVDWEAFMSSVLPRVIRKEELEGLINPLRSEPSS